MATDVGSILAVSLEARIAKMEREMRRATASTSREFDKIERRSREASRRLEQNMARAASTVRVSLGSIATAFGAGAVLGGLSQLPGAVRGAVCAVADLGRQADRVGMLTDELQGLQFGFEQAGIEAGTADSAIEEFAKRLGEARAGAGELKGILEANGVTLQNADGTMRTTMDLLRTYADLIQNAASEQDRLYLADKAFGGSGMAMAGALRDGSAAIDGMMFSAREAGAVLDAELITKAAETDRQCAALSRSIETFSKEKSVELIGALGDMGSALGYFARDAQNAWMTFSDFWDGMVGRDVSKAATDSLRRRLMLGQVAPRRLRLEPVLIPKISLPQRYSDPSSAMLSVRQNAPKWIT